MTRSHPSMTSPPTGITPIQQWVAGSLPHLGGPAAALPGRAHRSLRRRMVSRDPRGRVGGRERHRATSPAGPSSSPTTVDRRGGAARADRRRAAHHIRPTVSRHGPQADPSGLCARGGQRARTADPRTVQRPAGRRDRRRDCQRVRSSYASIFPRVSFDRCWASPRRTPRSSSRSSTSSPRSSTSPSKSSLPLFATGGGLLRRRRSKTTKPTPAMT